MSLFNAHKAILAMPKRLFCTTHFCRSSYPGVRRPTHPTWRRRWLTGKPARSKAIWAYPPAGYERIIHRSEEHTSELQSLMRISYAVFCLKKQNKNNQIQATHNSTQHTHVQILQK